MEKNDIQKVVEDIDVFLRKQLWFDFEVLEYLRNRLTVIGSIDISSQHNIEIYFDDVFFTSLPMEWQTDTAKKVLTVLEGEDEIIVNRRFQVEQGYYIFRFAPEDYPDNFSCLIGAKRISYLTL